MFFFPFIFESRHGRKQIKITSCHNHTNFYRSFFAEHKKAKDGAEWKRGILPKDENELGCTLLSPAAAFSLVRRCWVSYVGRSTLNSISHTKLSFSISFFVSLFISQTMSVFIFTFLNSVSLLKSYLLSFYFGQLFIYLSLSPPLSVILFSFLPPNSQQMSLRAHGWCFPHPCWELNGSIKK